MQENISSATYGQSALRGWSSVYRSSIKPRRCKQIVKFKESKARAESHRYHDSRGEHRLCFRPKARRWIEAANVLYRAKRLLRACRCDVEKCMVEVALHTGGRGGLNKIVFVPWKAGRRWRARTRVVAACEASFQRHQKKKWSRVGSCPLSPPSCRLMLSLSPRGLGL